MNSNHSWIKNLEYIIWDLDGTLYEVSPQLYQEIELNIYRLIAELKEISLEEAKQLHQQLYDQLQSNTLVLRAIGVDKERTDREINDVLVRNIRPNEFLVNQMKTLSSYKHLISTNSPQHSAHQKLKLIGFDDNFFDLVVGNPDTVGVLKPDPAPYNYLLEHTQTQPNKHLFVGDRYETDLETAKELGMYTALVHAKDGRADLEFPTAGDLVDYLALQSDN